jgi:hypothetical protein
MFTSGNEPEEILYSSIQSKPCSESCLEIEHELDSEHERSIDYHGKLNIGIGIRLR